MISGESTGELLSGAQMNLQQMLERDEGRKHEAYPDPLTKGDPFTIGIGHCGPEVHPGLVWDDNMIDDAFQLDIAAATQDCMDHFDPWFSALNDPRQAVLIAMCFQMGLARLLGFARTIQAVKEGRFEDAAAGMQASVWARQTPLRALRMSEQMSTGEWVLT